MLTMLGNKAGGGVRQDKNFFDHLQQLGFTCQMDEVRAMCMSLYLTTTIFGKLEF